MNDTSEERRRPRITVDSLIAGTAENLAIEVLAGGEGGQRVINQARIQKPGLALAGFVEYLHRGRVQILGNSEITYLKQLDTAPQLAAVNALVDYGVCCFVITKGLRPPDSLLAAADLAGVPLLRTRVVSSAAIYALSQYLEKNLAPSAQRHAVLVDVYGQGVLLLGPSGVGKSECALDLVVRGHRIVSDDIVEIRRLGDVLTGSSPEVTRYHMELRGIGIINVKDLFGVAAVRRSKDIDLVIRLDPWKAGREYERLGIDEQVLEILGVPLPYILMPVAPGRNLSVLVEVAARNHLLKLKGYFPARTLAAQVDHQARGGAAEDAESET
ncbi:MAG: HPr(Ser) kinase/phosphatase [Acidobacteriota bacterium]